jgi:hypothetical protein
VAIACISGISFMLLRQYTVRAPNDFGWAVSTAEALIAGINPYTTNLRDTVPYPLPVAFFGFPFLWTNEVIATDIFIGISIAILVFGILMNGKHWQLLILASAPLVFATEIGQWSPIITASWFFPALSGVFILIKPQTALPFFITKFRWNSVIIGIFLLFASLMILPMWPLEWLKMTQNYYYYVPFLVPLGIFSLLSILYFKKPDAKLLFLMSLFPYRSMYDLAGLGLIPSNLRQMLIYVFCSWLYLFGKKIWELDNITPASLHLLCLVFIVTTHGKDISFPVLRRFLSASGTQNNE